MPAAVPVNTLAWSLDLDRFEQHADSTVRSTQPLTVESTPDEWAYTISLPLPLSEIDCPPPLLVTAELVVEEGLVAGLIVAGDLRTSLSRESSPVAAGRQRLEVVLEQSADIARLVFRNRTVGGRCVFRLEGVTVQAAPPDALSFKSRLGEVLEAEPSRISVQKLKAALTSTATTDFDAEAVFARLRAKWSTVPAGLSGRRSSRDLATISDDELRTLWSDVHREATTGEGFGVRGWYQTLYRDILRGKSVLEIGSGMGIDGIEFGRHGANMTFVDIVESNLDVLGRLCRLFGIHAQFVYLKDLTSLETLRDDFDVVWCQGSLINVPFDFAAYECAAILKHLKPGGRWIELAYPRERWERDGSPPFSIWGTMTDGEGTPWVEWYDLARVLKRLAPAQFVPVLAQNFYHDDFNWFDLMRVA